MIESIKIEQLSKSFANQSVLKNINLDVQKGQFVTLLGPSGCGKTTLLRIIAGLERADSGCIATSHTQFMNTSQGIFLPSQRRKLGFVFQDYGLWPHMSVYDNIAFALKISGQYSRAQIGEKVRRALNYVQLDTYSDYRPAQLSGGQKQRVSIARALAAERQCILFDEPLSNLDANLRDELGQQIKMLASSLGLTCLYVTHDRREAQLLSDKIALLKDGQIHRFDSPENLFRHPDDEWIASFLDCGNIVPGSLLERDDATLWLVPRRALALDPAGSIKAEVVTSNFLADQYEIQAMLAGIRLRFYHDQPLKAHQLISLAVNWHALKSLNPYPTSRMT
ncbi:ABC transporter ATP-binding protein [Celerinatantimonas diazotrophica]|uniref:Iron(III) transport system ATP-binding protein n=1 Tax=Celerinatantimonas diazotrophica TaxID=412034 RepID=A0A4V6NE21_9GAMM|nr:ABC transporter ATP-binding protein [Celerinatantimonas diazotrophica]TCK46891.1 iron(III) transport system ATP-binding protein [Celerinatantimonas diazotrophica]CAG9295658.1 Vitamin B12 import ATP-binding protein BtuD [Celerinatantimonas diazotrophica]